MEKIIPDGTEVLIFNYIANWGSKQDEEHYIKGVIESSEELEEPTMHGSPWMIRFYKVKGEDNKFYYGTYDTGINGCNYIRTIPDHINKIKHKIKKNCEEINRLNDENFELYEQIVKLNREASNKPYIRSKSSESKICFRKRHI